MLRTIKATVAMTMVLALAACGSVTGPDLSNAPVGYDGNGPQTSPDELAPGSNDEGGGGLPGQIHTPNSSRRGPVQHEVAPSSDQEGGGSADYFAPTTGNDNADDEHDPEGGEYTPDADGDGM